MTSADCQRCGGGVGALSFAILLATGPLFASAQPAPVERETAAQSGSAAPESTPPTGYDQAIDLAVREFALGNFPEARSHFVEAHKLLPSARTYRGLGMVEYELKNYADAIEALQQALASRVKPLNDPLVRETRELLDRAKGYVARVHVEVDPAVATAIVDGVPVRPGPGGILLLQVGDRTLEFRAPGRLSERRQLKIAGGQEQTLRILLSPAMDATSAKVEARPLRKNPWLWAAVGVVLAGAAVGIGVGVAARGTDSRTAEPTGGTTGIALAGPPK